VNNVANSAFARTPYESLVFVEGMDAIQVVAMPAWKRAMDVVGVAILFVVLTPILVMISAAVMLESSGGPIFRQARVGRGGATFTCWKFRSMHRGADRILQDLGHLNEANGLIFKMKDDPRRTRVGKVLRRTSLDELPQLWNVLRGSMSLVGPRPPTIPEVLNYDEHELHRLAATPGMTGLWQVTLRRERHDLADMVELDTRYARECSFLLDIKILALTIPTVLSGKGSF
jgi:lipopolysaccharide/colanic/teichoic acid biosynthesis glycosyltransferase